MLSYLRNYFIKALEFLMGICVATLVGLALCQVVLRYVFLSPLIWAEEVSIMIMIWMAWLGASLLWLKESHICLDIITSRLSAGAKCIFAYLIDGLILVAAVALFLVSIKTVQAFIGLELSALSIDLSIKYYPVTIGSVVLFIAALLNLGNRYGGERIN